MNFVVYILYSAKHDKFYVGFTSNLIERFKSHNLLAGKGWTINFRPWQVVYCEFFETKGQAMIREKHLKSGQGRKWIKEKLNTELNEKGFISA